MPGGGRRDVSDICVDRKASYDYPSGWSEAERKRAMKRERKSERACVDVPEKEFVRIWNGAESAKDAAREMRVGRNAARCRAFALRAKGLKVKKHKKGRRKVGAA